MDLKEATNRIAAQKELVAKIREEVGKVIVGQEKLVDRLVLAMITDGHILLEGVPGLAKTLSCNTLAKASHLGRRDGESSCALCNRPWSRNLLRHRLM